MYENRVELDITISYSILAPQLYEVFMIENKELPGEQLIGLIKLLHNTLQTDGDLCYKVDYWRDINAVYKGGTWLVWYGGLKVTHWDFPELIRIHPCLGRRINNDMSKFVANEIIKVMLRAGIDAPHAKIYLLGMTFKENCPDTRNSRSVDIYHHLQE